MLCELEPNTIVNGIDVAALRDKMDAINEDPAQGMTKWKVKTDWKGGTRSDTKVSSYMIGGRKIDKDFTIRVDEPLELCGTNKFANPQEHLMAAMNSCMMVGYVAICAMEGIELHHIHIETEGEIDLRGFLGLDPNVKPGYDNLHYRVFIRGKGTPEQFLRVHELVKASSPNRFNMANPIELTCELSVQ